MKNMYWVAMDILRDFLEFSTIHGLNYISTAKVIFWILSLFHPSKCRPSQLRFYGLDLSALDSLGLEHLSASRTRNGRRVPLLPQSLPILSTTSNSQKWPSVLQGTLTRLFITTLWKLTIVLSLRKTRKYWKRLHLRFSWWKLINLSQKNVGYFKR